MTRLAHLFLALSFAAMQCVAPLAHAHAAGSTEHGIHLPEVVAQVAQDHQVSCCTVEADESRAVVAPDGKPKQERSSPASEAACTAAAVVVPDIAVADASLLLLTPPDRARLPALSFRKPYPQAPPAPIEL